MNILRCIIVDDEPISRKAISEHIGNTPFIELISEFNNIGRASIWLKHNSADIVFLDMEMPKRNGIQYLRHKTIRPRVILTTAYPEYSVDGYELDVVDYLLKPISYLRFIKAVRKAGEYISMHSTNTTQNASFIFVRSDKKIEKMELDEILFIESVGNYVTVHTASRKVIAYLTLKGIECQLPSQFIKVHQSFLVNFTKIDSIEGNTIKVNNKAVPISRQYRDNLMGLISKYLLKR